MYYRDVFRHDKNGAPLKWARIKDEVVSQWIEKARAAESKNIYISIQRFFLPERKEGEEQISDLFFDFDGEGSQEDCLKVVDEFITLGAEPDMLRIWFSGNRGFHLCVPGRLFGVTSSPNLNKYWRIIARDIKAKVNATTLDESIYTARKMLRAENTKHGKSGLYKIPLELSELSDMSMVDIKMAARSQCEPPPVTEPDAVFASMARLYQAAINRYTKSVNDTTWEPMETPHFEAYPPCIVALLKHGVMEIGTVNKTAFRLAAYFKSQELPISETIAVMKQWVLQIPVTMTHDLLDDGTVDYESLTKQTVDVIKCVYTNEGYGFSCQGILQLPKLKNYCTDECRALVERKENVSLFDALQVSNLGKRLYIQAEVVGRRDKSYAIPHKIKVWCEPVATDKCTVCPLYSQVSGITVEVTAKQSNILAFLDPTSTSVISRIALLIGVPQKKVCNRWKMQLVNQDAEVIYLAPRVTNEFTNEDRYTRQTAYYFGHGLEPNRGYEFSGYIHINQKNNALVLVLDKAVPLEDTLTQFQFTEEMQQQSKCFRPAANQTMAEKHLDIIRSLNYHHIKLWGRETLITAVDLVYHSVNKFWFQRELVNGWLDILIIGDSGQGKSKTAESLMRHYNLGVKVSGESAGRTGLLYTIPTKEAEPSYIIWGVLPRHHRRLVFVDELKSLIKSGGFGELTEVRSAGKVVVARTAFGQAMAETRLVLMTNATGRKTMGSYTYPAQALLDLIPDREDLRRCTYALGVATNQVEDAIINTDIETITPIAEQYESDVCHNHILWVWSLEPENIIITREVEIAALDLAQYMCQRYISNIPLIEPGDFRHKLMRVACAAAARMDSREGQKLIVTVDAVDYARDFLDTLYSDPSFNYLGYSKAYAEYALDDDTTQRLIQEFQSMWSEWRGIGKWIMLNTYTQPKEIAAASGMEIGVIRECLTWLTARKLLLMTTRGRYMKTEPGVKFFNALLPQEVERQLSSREIRALKGKDIDNGRDDF